MTRTEDKGVNFGFWMELSRFKSLTETAKDMNRLVADMPFDENWGEIDTKLKMTLNDRICVERGRLSRWLDDDASPESVYAFLEKYVPKSKLPYLTLSKKKQYFAYLCGYSPSRDNQWYVDITSDMKILLELLSALDLHLLDLNVMSGLSKPENY